MKNSVALAIIVKCTKDELPLLDACLKSVHKHVDGIFLTLTHQKNKQIPKEFRELAKKYGASTSDYVWQDHFANARNFSFAQVPKEYDFIIWLDTDDTVENPEKIKETAAVTPKGVSGIYATYDYAHDEYGNVTVPHVVARMVRNDGAYAWKSSFDDANYSVHETLNETRTTGKRVSEEFKVIHHADPTRGLASLYRNVEILEKMFKKQRKKGKVDPRILFYLGTHLYDARRFLESKSLLQQYMLVSGWANERSEALVYLGLIHDLEGKPGQSKQAYVLAISESPNNPRPYTEIADLCLRGKRPSEAAEWAMKAIECKKRQTAMALRPMDATFRPYMLYAQALSELGGTRLEDAMKYVDKALKLRPNDPDAQDLQEQLEHLIEIRDLNRAFAKLVREIGDDKERITSLLASTPEKLLNSPLVAQVRSQHTPKKVWPKKSMVIYCGPSVIEQWGPNSLKEGIGGSEEAVIRLSRELAKQGWDVHIYATPGKEVGLDEVPNGKVIRHDQYDPAPGEDDLNELPKKIQNSLLSTGEAQDKYSTYTLDTIGITWHHYWEFNPNDEFDVLVAWRSPWFFDTELTARKKYLWLHDVMPTNEFTVERLDNLDKVIVLSKYHRNLFPNIPDNKIFLSSNGITVEDFVAWDAKLERLPSRLIYMSSHVRGLQLVYDMWPDIKKAVPKATLDIYYGWESYVNVNKDNPERMLWKEEMERQVKLLEGVTDHGKIGQDQIVQEIFKSGLWIYPCVTGDTLVDMPRNYQQYPLGVPIRKLVGKKNFPVWSYNETTGAFELKNVNWVAKTREKAKIIKINWTDGTSLRCTPDHKIYTYKRGWVAAKDLQVNESAVALKKHMMVQVSAGQGKWPYEHRMIAEYMLGEIPKGYHVDHEDGNCFNNEPGNLQILSPSDHAKKTYKEQYSTRPLIERRKANLAKYRATEVGKKQLSEIGRKRSQGFWDGMSAEERQAFVDRRNVARYNHKVESIEEAGYEDVYDMNVTDNHNFIAGGVVVHNCPFPEIFCVTALKAQAGGAIPVSSNFAALDETVQFGVKIPMKEMGEGAGYGNWDKQEVERFKTAIIDLLKHPEKQEAMRPKMQAWARQQSWAAVAESWSDEMLG